MYQIGGMIVSEGCFLYVIGISFWSRKCRLFRSNPGEFRKEIGSYKVFGSGRLGGGNCSFHHYIYKLANILLRSNKLLISDTARCRVPHAL